MSRFAPTVATQIFVTVSLIATVILAAFAQLVSTRIDGQGQRLAFQAALEDARLIALIGDRTLAQPQMTFKAAVRSLSSSGTLFRFGDGPLDTRVEFYTQQGERIFDSTVAGDKRGPRTAANPEPPADVVSALKGDEQAEPYVVDAAHVAASVALRSANAVVGAVRVVKPNLGMQTILAELGPSIALLAAGLLLLALLAALGLGRMLSQPLRALTTNARAIATGDRARALPKPFGREVTELTMALGEMRRELEDAQRIERLSQELSHELKNPLAAVRALTEALQAGALTDPEAGPRLLHRIDEAAVRMQALVADLLALAQLQARGVALTERVGLRAVLANACEQASAKWPNPPPITLDVEATLMVCGDTTWLGRAFTNLVDNALHAGHEAILSARVEDRRVLVQIANPGEIPPAIRDRLFERFVSRRPDGTGLGLALARSVAEAHGGYVRLVEAGPPHVVIEFGFGPS